MEQIDGAHLGAGGEELAIRAHCNLRGAETTRIGDSTHAFTRAKVPLIDLCLISNREQILFIRGEGNTLARSVHLEIEEQLLGVLTEDENVAGLGTRNSHHLAIAHGGHLKFAQVSLIVVAQNSSLLDQPVSGEVIGVKVPSVARENHLGAIPDKVARVHRQVLNEQLLDDLGPVVFIRGLLLTFASDLNQLGLAVQTCSHQQVV